MEGILQNVGGWIIGIISLVIVILVINGVIFLVNRLAKGPKRIEALSLVITRETIKKYVPLAITEYPDGRTQLDTAATISNMFRDKQAIFSESELKKWATEGKANIVLYSQSSSNSLSKEQAAQLVINSLIQKGFSRQRLEKSKFYSIPSSTTSNNETAYLVIIGNIPSGPGFYVGLG